MEKRRVFISSVQKELAVERRAIRDFIGGDPMLSKFFEAFLFEDLPASDRRSDQVYLTEVDRCTIYVGIFGNEYGFIGSDGVSPTEHEFLQAKKKGKPRLILVKGTDDKIRHPKMQELLRNAGSELIRKRFMGITDLTGELYASLVDYLESEGLLRTLPFDAARCLQATIKDLSVDKLSDFLERAQAKRNYPLGPKTAISKALAHLNLLENGKPNHAAMLLFGNQPQRFILSSHIKCLHFHGTVVQKPIPSYQTYKGTVFDMIEQSVDFVMSKIDLLVGTREKSNEVPTHYEIPRLAVSEAIVNAVAHRDYTSNASVQVMLFADRLEVWNPGQLPPPLTPERLQVPHASIPHNPLIAESLYLAGIIEQAGTGILDMMELCRSAGLPKPEFRQDGGFFIQTLWRNWLTESVLRGMNLNERQIAVIRYIEQNQSITNALAQEILNLPRRTAVRDLMDLVKRNILSIHGAGRGTHYRMKDNRAGIVPNVPKSRFSKRAEIVPIVPTSDISGGLPEIVRSGKSDKQTSKTRKRKA